MSNLLGIIDVILKLIGNILYPTFAVLFAIIDGLQDVFYAFAGLSDKINGISAEGGADVNGVANSADTRNGIVYYLLRNSYIKNIFFSMLILAVFLLVIFTAMAFIKNMYNAKQKKWQEIISSAIKGAINFVFIPVCCLLGVIAGNFLLRAISDATSETKDVGISRQLFVAAAYNANKFRKDGWTQEDVSKLREDYKQFLAVSRKDGSTAQDIKDENVIIKDGQDGEYYAQFVDTMYKSGNYKSIWLVKDVYPYYDTWNINYLLLGAGGIFMLFALVKVSFGAIKRLFNLVLLYIISPVICSMYPLDDGKAVGTWKGEFIKNFFSVYGAVVGMNLFYIIVPIISNLKINVFIYSEIISLLITISALFMVTDFISLTSTFIGSLTGASGNVFEMANNISSSVKSWTKKGMGKIGEKGKNVAGAFSKSYGVAKERKKEINEAREKAGLKTKADYKGNEEEWERYKDSKEYKKSLEEYEKAKQNLGGGSAKAFGGTMLSSLGHGTVNIGKDIVDALSSAMGFGKVSNLVKSSKASMEEGVEGEKIKKSSAQVVEDLKKGDLEKISKDFSNPKTADKLYTAVKDTDEFKEFQKQSGARELKSAADVRSYVSGHNDYNKSVENQAKAEFDYAQMAEALAEALKEVSYTTTTPGGSPITKITKVDEETAKKAASQLMAGKDVDTGDEKLNKAITEALSAGISVEVKKEKGKEDIETKTVNADTIQTARNNVEAANARTLETGKNLRAELKDDSDLAKSLDGFLGSVKQTLHAIEQNEELKNVDKSIVEAAKEAAEHASMLKQTISKIGENYSKEIVKAIRQLNKTVDDKK